MFYRHELVNIEEMIPKNLFLRVIEKYFDVELQRDMNIGDIIEVDNLRAYELTTINNNAHMKLCKTI